MRGAIPPIPEYKFVVWYLVKYRDKFTLLKHFHISDITLHFEWLAVNITKN